MTDNLVGYSLSGTREHIITNLYKALATKDEELQRHASKVGVYALKIASKLGLQHEAVEDIYCAAIFHDIGKLGIAQSILQKPGPLDHKEWEIMKAHPIIGASLINQIPLFTHLSSSILYHHKHYSGTGYPGESLQKEGIPLGARIIAVADSFEAMTADRPYRKALTEKEAHQELLRCSGSQFDPEIVATFLRLREEENSAGRVVGLTLL